MQKLRTIIVPEPSEVLTIPYYHNLARGVSGLRHGDGKHVSRREIPDWMADQLFDEKVRFIRKDGTPFEISDTAIDGAFNDDGTFRWLSYLVAFAETPPRQAPQARLAPRLILLSLAFWIAYPDIAKGFAEQTCLNMPQCRHWSWAYFERCADCPYHRRSD
jgi:hypothetical protein